MGGETADELGEQSQRLAWGHRTSGCAVLERTCKNTWEHQNEQSSTKKNGCDARVDTALHKRRNPSRSKRKRKRQSE
jgi:hypothetical protein